MLGQTARGTGKLFEGSALFATRARRRGCGRPLAWYGPYDLTILVGFAGAAGFRCIFFTDPADHPCLRREIPAAPPVQRGRGRPGAATLRPRGRMGNGPAPHF